MCIFKSSPGNSSPSPGINLTGVRGFFVLLLFLLKLKCISHRSRIFLRTAKNLVLSWPQDFSYFFLNSQDGCVFVVTSKDPFDRIIEGRYTVHVRWNWVVFYLCIHHLIIPSMFSRVFEKKKSGQAFWEFPAQPYFSAHPRGQRWTCHRIQLSELPPPHWDGQVFQMFPQITW